MKRLREEPGDEAPRPTAGDYFVVSGENWSWQVSTEMARHIEACLDAEPRPVWVKFVDLAGSRIRVRAGLIEYICQSTHEQRATDRALGRMLREERKADKSWDEDD